MKNLRLLVCLILIAGTAVVIPARAGNWLGLRYNMATDDQGGGAMVVEVLENSPAKFADIHRGDIIKLFNGHSLANIDDLRNLLSDIPAGKPVEVVLYRDGVAMIKSVNVGRVIDLPEDNQLPVLSPQLPVLPKAPEDAPQRGTPVVGKLETLNAISEIYSSVRPCIESRLENNIDDFHYAAQSHVRDFKFLWNENTITFSYRSIITKNSSYSGHSEDDDGNWYIRYNPADIDYYNLTEDELARKQSNIFGLLELSPVCKNGDDCVYHSGERAKYPSGDIKFCTDGNARARIVRALQNLYQFYQPSKRLPF